MKVITVITSIFLISFFYGAVSFYSLDLDFRNWGEGERFLFIMLFFLIIFLMIIIIGGMILEEKEQKNK